MPRCFFVTFGDERNYRQSLERIAGEARALGVFDEVLVYDTRSWGPDFRREHGPFIATHPRGLGHWIWKPYLVRRVVEEQMEEGDLLVYADAGCTLNPAGIPRLREYFRMVEESPYGMLAFCMEHHPEKYWTKGDVFAAVREELSGFSQLRKSGCGGTCSGETGTNSMDLDQRLKVAAEQGQLIGGIFVMRRCEHARRLVETWWRLAQRHELIDDSPSATPNFGGFRDHRHDQSVFSLLRKVMGAVIVPDETYFMDWSQGATMPLLATRRRC